MLISADEINKILNISGTQVTSKGKKYFEQSRVKVADFKSAGEDYLSKSYVEGSYVYDVNIIKEKGNLRYSCNCPASVNRDTPCKHIVATIFNMYINEDEYLNFNQRDEIDKYVDENFLKYENYSKQIKEEINSNDIIKYYELLEISKDNISENINVVPILSIEGYDNFKVLDVSFKIGNEKMYKLKDLVEFYEAVLDGNVFKYGKNLEFKHTMKNFNPNSINLVNFIVKRVSSYDDYSRLGNYYFNLEKEYKGVIRLIYSALDDFFDMYNGKNVIIEGYDYVETSGIINFIEKNPPLNFDLKEEKDGISISTSFTNFYTFKGSSYIYVLYKDNLYRCSSSFKENVYPLIKEMIKKNQDTMFIPRSECTSLCQYVIPRIKQACNVNIKEDILEKYKPEKLDIKTYLDLDENSNVTCDVKFIYGKSEINPFDGTQVITCNRDILKEKKAKHIFKDSKFIIDSKKKNIYLVNENDIYNFLTIGIQIFSLNFDVYITENLKKRQIIRPRGFAMGVRVDNGLLKIDFSDLNYLESDLKNIFKAYKLKKKYYRMKNGSFVDLESKGIKDLVNLTQYLNVSEENLSSGQIEVPKYRAIYLNNVGENNRDITLNKDKKFESIIEDISNSEKITYEAPSNFNGKLREYQITGFNWLKTLDRYNFGGILADDMGLGKTIQLIALLLDEKNKNSKEGKSKNTISIVVCPSSLYLNWENEINKFAPDLKVLVVNGKTKDREEKIESALKYDVVITSYDMLKRDVEKYKKINFRYVIADEAQYIKNDNTKNSKALKALNGITKFALTGTPIENSLSELWSIFDFCMPGYLYNYKKFKDEYETCIVKDEDKTVMQKLRLQVRPFILRRIKKDVLKELPDKTETVMYSNMEEEQRKVYDAYLLQAQTQIQSLANGTDFNKNKLKVLALITRLRQICCHPSLFLEEYKGNSSKLEQCIDIVNDALQNGHKILLFSQFTSMLDILKSEFNKRNIRYMELTGKTKSDDRLDMVAKFNSEDEVKVFLISLKAGGTGLNLIGADVVIHFDPWWNLSVQNQATDRAHRIGQKKNVQVFKLISKDSIEEKIQKLQKKKSDIANDIIRSGEMFINKMTKEDIMELFK